MTRASAGHNAGQAQFVDGRGGRAAAATGTATISDDEKSEAPMLRPPTHTDPNAIPRNGTDVPWVDLPERRPEHERESAPAGDGHVAADGTPAATGTAPQSPGT